MENYARCAYSRQPKFWWQKNGSIWQRISVCSLVCILALLSTSIQQTTGHTNVNKIHIDFTNALVEKNEIDKSTNIVLTNSKNSLNDGYESGFRPIIPSHLQEEYMSNNVFTREGNYRVFHPDDSDLRHVAQRKTQDIFHDIEQNTQSSFIWQQPNPVTNNTKLSEVSFADDIADLESLLNFYTYEFFGKQALPYVNVTMFHLKQLVSPKNIRRITREAHKDMLKLEHEIPRSDGSGRLLFTAGLKKVMWPIYMGLQIMKSLLFAMFLPTLIGSVGQLLGKGIISGSSPLFIRPMEPPQDLDFNFDDDKKFTTNDDSNKDSNNLDNYGYPTPEASQVNSQYAYHPNSVLPNRYGQDSYLSALQSISSASFKNSNSISSGSLSGMMSPSSRNKPIAAANVNTFQTFQKVPASSLLLSNYDPFYSPLLSRLDSVFAQLKLNSNNEVCREKAICLMYANPAKYAPYSNLVSAQLSRELNELRKPTSDNPDILRFFKYMRAAKDGQDGTDCEKTFDDCKEFKDYENPAMVSTYHDINKLVQARKLA